MPLIPKFPLSFSPVVIERHFYKEDFFEIRTAEIIFATKNELGSFKEPII